MKAEIAELRQTVAILQGMVQICVGSLDVLFKKGILTFKEVEENNKKTLEAARGAKVVPTVGETRSKDQASGD